MPVTAKLSRKFYETFGEDVTNELVDWFNSVDATYRGDLRELNELNFARFDAKQEQRFAEFDANLERRLVELDAKWDGRWTQLDAKLEQRLAELRRDLSIEIARTQQTMLRWMFAFWTPTALGIIGTAIAVVALLLRR